MGLLKATTMYTKKSPQNRSKYWNKKNMVAKGKLMKLLQKYYPLSFGHTIIKGCIKK